MAPGKKLIKLALFGQPVKSSLSPTIHHAFAEQFDLDISYQLIETAAEGFPAALEDFRQAGGSGCNITLPLKQEAWRLAAQASKEVEQAQAANTLVLQPSSGWFAHTTDGIGFVTDLKRNHQVALAGRRVLVLGAGGAVAGILGRVLADGPQEVVIVNRNQQRARDLAERFNTLGNLDVTSWEELPSWGRFDLVINATSLGHHGEAPRLTAAVFAAGAMCYDMNYFKASLPLKALVESLGHRYVDGLGMLVEQAAESFFIWTGERPNSKTVTSLCRERVA
ncbi:MAG: shikimate dehydrogenase [Xanthomonadales bacterium]|nr:shikimate dehydrogenase [Xanthomonadales bacterium]